MSLNHRTVEFEPPKSSSFGPSTLEQKPLERPPKMRIYQAYYDDKQFSGLDHAFIPYDWRGNPQPEYREGLHFVNFFKSEEYLKSDYVGIVSHKFFDKTGISGAEFIRFMKSNPGYDVYFVNPFPYQVCCWFNVWDQGESWHPGIIDAAQKLFDDAGMPIRISNIGRNDWSNLLYCNYWVGNRKFWETYMRFFVPLFLTADQGKGGNKKKTYLNITPYLGGGLSIIPFIFERLFSTFLSLDKEISACPYKFSSQQTLAKCLRCEERQLVDRFGPIINSMDSMVRQDDRLGRITEDLLRQVFLLRLDRDTIERWLSFFFK